MPAPCGGHDHDALLLLGKALEKAGALDKEKVRCRAGKSCRAWWARRVFNFSARDHGGLGMDAFEMQTVKNGKFVVYSDTAAKK